MKTALHHSLILALSAGLLLAGCEPAPEPEPEADVQEPAEPQEHEMAWSYEGETGPEHWGMLQAEYATCAAGTEQSPIDLAGASTGDVPDLTFDYQPTSLEIENLMHTVQVEYAPGSTMQVGDTSYELVQFHFHTPSEHHLQGREFPMEVHLVHAASDGRLAVVGMLIEEGAPNEAMAPFFENLPAGLHEVTSVAGTQINAEALLPQDRAVYHYDGSLTTPPCTEGVSWFVMREPVQMSGEQIAAVESVIGTSDRPIQPLGERELVLEP